MVTFLPRRIADLEEPDIAPDWARRVEGARVVLADHDLLRRDFPGLQRASPEALEGWLLRYASLVSTAQAQPNEVNTPIRLAGEPVQVYRPPRYGRAFIVPVPGESGEPEGLLDLKGVGVCLGVKPRARLHCDGLLTLGEALEEYMTQLLLEAVFRYSGAAYRTLPAYAILDLGFDSLSKDRAYPAGVLVRRAHRRHPGNRELPPYGSPAQKAQLGIELLLRHFGITSANPGSSYEFIEEEDGTLRCRFGGVFVSYHSEEQIRWLRPRLSPLKHRRFEGVNIQTTRGGSTEDLVLLDFGHYRIRDRFTDPILSMVLDRPFSWGGVILPEDPLFVQPDPDLAVSMEDWGEVELSEEEAARGLLPWSQREALGAHLAHELREERMTGSEVRAAIDDLIERTISRWP